MHPLAESSPDVVALLLDDLAPPRLGTLLRAARKERGSTRREIAHRVGITAGELRRYERGDTTVPPSTIVALAECYGEDLTAQFAAREPIQIDGGHLVVGGVEGTVGSDDADEMLGTYVWIVSRLRSSQPGEPIALRANDLVALSNALGQDADRVEARIVEILGCTPQEAHSLHAEMLRRKLVLPVAGLVAGLSMVAGVGIANASPNHAAAVAPTHVAAAHITAGHLAAGHVVTAVEAPAPTTVVVKPQAPTTTTTATDPETSDAHTTVPRPIITPDTTPVSIPPNETVTIIAP